jgi:hypothetical protein
VIAGFVIKLKRKKLKINNNFKIMAIKEENVAASELITYAFISKLVRLRFYLIKIYKKKSKDEVFYSI